MKKVFWMPLILALAGLPVLAACNLENKASDFGLAPAGVFGVTGSSGTVRDAVITAHACCETRPAAYTTDGMAEWAVDGITSHWWHSNYNANTAGYSVDTSETGHMGDFGNYLRRGDGDHINGYTWTQDPSLALDGPDYPVQVQTVAPAYGAHWITLDLGEEIELGTDQIGRLGYYPRAANAVGNLGQPGVTFELYVSKKDFGWLVDQGGVTKVTVKDADGNEVNTVPNTGNVYHYLNIQPESPLAFRYVQLRWIFSSTNTAADARTANAANLVFKVYGKELDYSYLVAAYTRGIELLKTLNTTTHNYNYLRVALVNAQAQFKPPDPTDVDTLQKKLAHQDTLDAAADTLLALIYKIDPPKEQPEVEL